jgi:hypothetical protein
MEEISKSELNTCSDILSFLLSTGNIPFTSVRWVERNVLQGIPIEIKRGSEL